MIFAIAFSLSIGCIFGLFLGLLLSTRFPPGPRTLTELQAMLPRAAIESVSRREYNEAVEEWQDHDELVIYTGWDATADGMLVDYQAPAR